MENDNTLCVPISHLNNIATKHQRYFISTGIGASGWIMSRAFIDDFILRYEASNSICPDCEAANIMTNKDRQPFQQWAVTRQYLVSHSLLQPMGSQGLTVASAGQSGKRLPRCFEPHRGMWLDEPRFKKDGERSDKYGWDYFDFDACPGSEIFPCELQLNSSFYSQRSYHN